MGAFGSFTLTNKGRTLQSKAQAGSKLNYTRIAVGSGQLGGQSILLLNGLIDQKKSLPVTRLRMQPPNKAIIGTVLSNQDVTTGFYFREIGVFAQDPDEGEILYCYTNAGTDAEYIPAVGGSNVIEKTIDCIVVIGTASNVSATIDDSLVFTRESEFNAKFDASGGHKHTGAAGDGPKLTSASYAGGSVTDAALGTRTADPTTSTAYGLVGSITQWFSWITKYFKAITGKANPFDAPDITLAATKTHVDNTVVHLTAAERSAWNAAETNAKNASIPKTEKGAASGVAALDTLKNLLASGLRLGATPYYTNQAFLLTLAATSNQKADIILTGPIHGRIRVTVSGAYAGIDARGSIVKVFSAVLSPPNVVNSAVSRYIEATENLPDHISIGEIGYDSVNSRFAIPIEARSAYINTFSITVESWSSVRDSTFSLSPVYTGTGATTLPKAVPVIEDNTETKSGYKIQKHQLTLDTGSTSIFSSGSMDTLYTTGFYYVTSSATGRPPEVPNGGLCEVFKITGGVSSTGSYQRITDFINLRTFIRYCNSSVWSAWVEVENANRKNVANGYAGLNEFAMVPDANIGASIARRATLLSNSGVDMNNLTTEGEYYTASDAIVATFLNMPPVKYSFHLKVSRHAGYNQTMTIYGAGTGANRLRMFSRNLYSGTWSNWFEIENTNSKGTAEGYAGLDLVAKVPRVNTYSSLGGASATQITNVDTMLTAGVYPTIQNPTGAPENFFGMLRVTVDSGEAGNGGNWVLQEWMGQAGGNRYTRLKINALAWTAWVKQWDSFNDAPLFTTRGTVSNNTDYNTLVKNGVYMIYNPTGTTNASPAAYGTLTVSTTDPSNVNNSYIKQEVAEAATGIVYTRSKYTPTSWTPWVSNITSAGGTMTAALTRNYDVSNNVYKYNNLAGYSSTGGLTGTIKITMPKTWSNTMMRIKVNGYDYSTVKGGWELILGGYNYKDGTPIWISTTATLVGSAPFTSVRFAHDGTNNCILLGTLTTVWNIGNIEVSEFLASFTQISGWDKGWGISLITSETGIANVSTPVLNQVGSNASTLGGYSAAQVTQGTLAYAVTTGTAPTLVATFNPAVAALSAGLRVTIKAHAATTGPVTLNVNGLGAKSIKKPNGNNSPLALGGVYTVVYDGTAFILQGEGGEYGTATAAEVLAGKTIGTENGLVNGTMPDKRGIATDAVGATLSGYDLYLNTPEGYYNSVSSIRVREDNLADPKNWRSDRTLFGKQGTMPVITVGDDPAVGVGRWGNGDLAVYPREGYRKGGSGAGEIKVSVAQLASVSYVKRVTGSTTAYGAMTSKNVMSNTYTFPYVTVTGLDFRPTNVRAWHDAYPDTWCVLTATKLTWTDSFPITWRHSTSGMNPEIFFSNDGFQLTINVAKGATVVWEAW